MIIKNRYRLSRLLAGLLLIPSSTRLGAQTLFSDGLHDSYASPPPISTVRYGIIKGRSGETNLLRSSSPTLSAATNGGADLNLFGNLGNNFLDSFRGNNIYLHLTAIAATALCVEGEVDYNVEHYLNQHSEFGSWAHPVVSTGTFLPFIAGGSLFVYAKTKNDNETLGASFAVLQASLIEFLYNSTLKAVTGRPNPDWRHVSDMDSLSRTFRFGFLRGGVFWGWPSGHTASTMAVVSALTSYYPDKVWLKVAGFGLVAYTMFGVSANNRGGMHWFSDAVAGALMSYAVGSTVGKYYRSVYSGQVQTAPPQSQSNPSMGFDPDGITISFLF
jgi:membrane-associated phospholipid phosphatase